MLSSQEVYSFIAQPGYEPQKFDELILSFHVAHQDIPVLSLILDTLVAEGKIVKGKKGRYGVPEALDLLVGKFVTSRGGSGFFIPDDRSGDIFIPADDANGAIHSDRVTARMVRPAVGSKRAEGQIRTILSRGYTHVVGLLEADERRYVVRPDDTRLHLMLSIPSKRLNGAVAGDKVVASITQYPKDGLSAKGEITEILGTYGDTGVDILSVIKRFGLPLEFPPEVVAQADAFEPQVMPYEIEGRLDLRGETIITIDGEDAKDLDDAIHVIKTDTGYKLGVHIADVSHYVTENTPLDKEAFNRGTSVYFPDRVVPMLPPALSNGICSLNQGVNRLTLSVLMDVDESGAVTGYEIKKSVICSAERMTYTNVTKLLTEADSSELALRYAHIFPMLKTAERLAMLLRKRRFAMGSIDFDLPEPKIALDEKGKPVEIKRYPITVSNHMIEEFMLICNQVVARHAFDAESPFVYRIHEPPSPEKLESLKLFLLHLSVNFNIDPEGVRPMEIQKLLGVVKGMDAERAVNTIALRSMSKARYAPNNLGHFGLAAEYYCHFTSPIRRYPDLIIHRILKEQLEKGGIPQKRRLFLDDFAARAALRSSETEVLATEAERDADKLKICEYMQGHIGEEFEGIISSVAEFGMFVELDNTIEGMVSLPSLNDDYYIFEKDHFCLTGEHTGKTYSIGDRVKIVVAASDPASRRVDFVLAELYQNYLSGGLKKFRGAGAGAPDRFKSPKSGMGKDVKKKKKNNTFKPPKAKRGKKKKGI